MNIAGLGPMGGLYMRTCNVVLFLAYAGLNQGQKALRSLPPGVPSCHSKTVSVPGCALGSKGRCGNCLVEIQSCETSLSPFSNEFPDHQMCSQF